MAQKDVDLLLDEMKLYVLRQLDDQEVRPDSDEQFGAAFLQYIVNEVKPLQRDGSAITDLLIKRTEFWRSFREWTGSTRPGAGDN